MATFEYWCHWTSVLRATLSTTQYFWTDWKSRLGFPAFLNLSRSYLPDGNCFISVCNYVTELTNVTWVVKGSILGPSLFYLYMLPLGLIMRNDNIAYRCYADYTQIHVTPSPADYLLINLLCQCIKQLKDWMWWNLTPTKYRQNWTDCQRWETES